MRKITVLEFYNRLNNDDKIPTIDGQGNFTADEMIWFGNEVLKNITNLTDVTNSVNLKELERKLDATLKKETKKTLTEWLKQQNLDNTKGPK